MCVCVCDSVNFYACTTHPYTHSAFLSVKLASTTLTNWISTKAELEETSA